MKILIIRFSSFGDILQTLSVAGRLREAFPQSEIHWVSRTDLKSLVEHHPAVQKVWLISKGQGIWQLLLLARQLKQERFTHIYDAHNNLRSRFISAYLNGFLGWRRLQHQFLRRSIFRTKRLLLFRFRINLFVQPFSGQRDLLKPLEKWGIPFRLPAVPQMFLDLETVSRMQKRVQALGSDYIAIAPSAAFELKRWPVEYWQRLIQLSPNSKFVILGGKEDGFLQRLVPDGSNRVLNWAGELDFMESAAVVKLSRLLVANDTGLLHVAEQLGIPCVALMGPAPFGFPSRPLTTIMERSLSCRPCSKHGQGPCVNPEFQDCLRGISPEQVSTAVRGILNA